MDIVCRFILNVDIDIIGAASRRGELESFSEASWLTLGALEAWFSVGVTVVRVVGHWQF